MTRTDHKIVYDKIKYMPRYPAERQTSAYYLRWKFRVGKPWEYDQASNELRKAPGFP